MILSASRHASTFSRRSFCSNLWRGYVSDAHAARCLYAILGVSDTATNSDIKAAFKQRAKELHPDRLTQPGSSDADVSAFLQLVGAYETLSDPHKRQLYDLDRSGTVLPPPLHGARSPHHQPRGESPNNSAVRNPFDPRCWRYGLGQWAAAGPQRVPLGETPGSSGSPPERLQHALQAYRSALEGDLHRALMTAFLGPALQLDAWQLPTALEAEERSHPDVGDDVLHLVSGRTLLGLVRLRRPLRLEAEASPAARLAAPAAPVLGADAAADTSAAGRLQVVDSRLEVADSRPGGQPEAGSATGAGGDEAGDEDEERWLRQLQLQHRLHGQYHWVAQAAPQEQLAGVDAAGATLSSPPAALHPGLAPRAVGRQERLFPGSTAVTAVVAAPASADPAGDAEAAGDGMAARAACGAGQVAEAEVSFGAAFARRAWEERVGLSLECCPGNDPQHDSLHQLGHGWAVAMGSQQQQQQQRHTAAASASSSSVCMSGNAARHELSHGAHTATAHVTRASSIRNTAGRSNSSASSADSIATANGGSSGCSSSSSPVSCHPPGLGATMAAGLAEGVADGLKGVLGRETLPEAALSTAAAQAVLGSGAAASTSAGSSSNGSAGSGHSSSSSACPQGSGSNAGTGQGPGSGWKRLWRRPQPSEQWASVDWSFTDASEGVTLLELVLGQGLVAMAVRDETQSRRPAKLYVAAAAAGGGVATAGAHPSGSTGSTDVGLGARSSAGGSSGGRVGGKPVFVAALLDDVVLDPRTLGTELCAAVHKYYTPGVHHCLFYRPQSPVPRLLCRLRRAWMPPSSTWLFAPRVPTHDVGGWYMEWEGHGAGTKPGWLHPSVYLLTAGLLSLDLEAKRLAARQARSRWWPAATLRSLSDWAGRTGSTHAGTGSAAAA